MTGKFSGRTVTVLSFVSILASCLTALAATKPAAASYCDSYNDYVVRQCLSKSSLTKTVNAEFLENYSAESCRSESFLTILETDEVARGLCAPLVNGQMIERLRARRFQ